MKRFTKIMLILAGILAVLGIFFSLVGFHNGVDKARMAVINRVEQFQENLPLGIGSLISRALGFSRDMNEVQEFKVKNVESISMDTLYGNIVFDDSESNKIEVEVDAPSSYKYTCEAEDGILNYVDQTSSELFKNRDITITIRIPEDTEFHAIDLQSDAGTIKIWNTLSANSIDLNLDAGELDASTLVSQGTVSLSVRAGRISVDAVSAKELNVDCTVGEMNIQAMVDGDIRANTTTGRIQLEIEGEQTDYNYVLTRGIGNITINGEEKRGFSRDFAIDNSASKSMYLECGVGEIQVTIGNQE